MKNGKSAKPSSPTPPPSIFYPISESTTTKEDSSAVLTIKTPLFPKTFYNFIKTNKTPTSNPNPTKTKPSPIPKHPASSIIMTSNLSSPSNKSWKTRISSWPNFNRMKSDKKDNSCKLLRFMIRGSLQTVGLLRKHVRTFSMVSS